MSSDSYPNILISSETDGNSNFISDFRLLKPGGLSFKLMGESGLWLFLFYQTSIAYSRRILALNSILKKCKYKSFRGSEFKACCIGSGLEIKEHRRKEVNQWVSHPFTQIVHCPQLLTAHHQCHSIRRSTDAFFFNLASEIKIIWPIMKHKAANYFLRK